MITRFFTSLLLFSLLFVVPFFIWLPLLVLSLLWYPFYVEGLFLFIQILNMLRCI
jgi:hypothetical protein